MAESKLSMMLRSQSSNDLEICFRYFKNMKVDIQITMQNGLYTIDAVDFSGEKAKTYRRVGEELINVLVGVELAIEIEKEKLARINARRIFNDNKRK